MDGGEIRTKWRLIHSPTREEIQQYSSAAILPQLSSAWEIVSPLRAGHSLIAVSKASYRDGEMVGVHLDWRKEYRESWYRTESGYVCEDVSRRY